MDKVEDVVVTEMEVLCGGGERFAVSSGSGGGYSMGE